VVSFSFHRYDVPNTPEGKREKKKGKRVDGFA